MRSNQSLILFSKKLFGLREKLRMGTKTLTPVNYEEEKEKFLNSKYYNPIFFYQIKKERIDPKEIDKLFSEVKTLNVPLEIKDYLNSYLNDLNLLNQTINSIGTKSFPENTSKLFDWTLPDLENVESLFPEVELENEGSNALYGADEIRNAFLETLDKKYQLKKIKVELDGFNPFTIRAGSKKVIIGIGVKRFSNNLKRLIVHELESHVLQQINISNSSTPLLKLYKYAEGELTGEGLAVYNEITTKTITKQALDNYYFRLKAVSMLKKSFREIFKEISKHIPPKHAYIITYRVKRGMEDTSLSGGFPKDAAYILGFYKIKSALEKYKDSKLYYKTKVSSLYFLLEKAGYLKKTKLMFPEFLHF